MTRMNRFALKKLQSSAKAALSLSVSAIPWMFRPQLSLFCENSFSLASSKKRPPINHILRTLLEEVHWNFPDISVQLLRYQERTALLRLLQL